MSASEPTTELELAEDVESLKAHIEHLGTQLAGADETIAALHEQLRLLLVRRFGASSERVADGQLGLFNEAEVLAASAAQAPGEDEACVAVCGHTRHRRGKRSPLPEHLVRVEVVHELPERERVCPHDGVALESFGEEISEQLDVEPARFRVLRHRRVKYRCPCCEAHLRTAPMTPQPIPKSQASPGLLAFIATSKYVDGLPLYRLAQQFERVGVSIPRQTQGRWMVQSGAVVQPLINLLRERLLEGGYVHCDETTVQVLEEPEKRPSRNRSCGCRSRAPARHRWCCSTTIPRAAPRCPSACLMASRVICKPTPTPATTRSCASTPSLGCCVSPMRDATSSTGSKRRGSIRTSCPRSRLIRPGDC